MEIPKINNSHKIHNYKIYLIYPNLINSIIPIIFINIIIIEFMEPKNLLMLLILAIHIKIIIIEFIKIQ